MENNVLSDHWQEKRNAMQEAMKQFHKGIIDYAQSSASGFDHRLPFNADLINKKLIAIRQRFPDFQWGALCESPFSRQDSLGNIENRLVSNIFFWHLNVYLSCRAFIPPFISVLEIGGGYGGLARLFYLGGIRDYTIVDMPESLFFARTFLEANTITGIRFIALDDTQNIKEVDLAISQGSFGEMPQETVNFWADVLKKKAKYVYSLNYLKGGHHGTDAIFPEEGWEIIKEELDPPVILGDIIGQWREVIYKRI